MKKQKKYSKEFIIWLLFDDNQFHTDLMSYNFSDIFYNSKNNKEYNFDEVYDYWIKKIKK